MKGPAGSKRRNYRRRHSSRLDDESHDQTHPSADAEAILETSGNVEAADTEQIHDEPSLIVHGHVTDESTAGDFGVPGDESASCVSILRTTQAGSDSSTRRDAQNGGRIASGIGFHMLRAMGWVENTGLGQLSKGIVDPILPTSKAGNVGIGFQGVYDTQQEAIRAIQKRTREERDRKLKLKLERAQEADEEDAFMRESFLAVSTQSGAQPSESGFTYVEDTSDILSSKTILLASGSGHLETGQCPHCKQRFETKHGLKSHIRARHSKLLQTTKRQLKKEKRQRGSGKQSGKRGTARELAPVKQNFSVYD